LVDLFDNTFVIAGLIVSIAAAFGVPLIYALTRTRDITLRGDFRLTANEKQLQDMKDAQDKGFAEMSRQMKENTKEIRDAQHEINERVNDLEKEVYNFNYRLKYLESKNGGARAPV
jgi:predicted nuclease with TOPRIM domain